MSLYYKNNRLNASPITDEVSEGSVLPVTSGAVFDALDDFSSYEYLTEAEYEALSDEEKNNGKVYVITDSEDDPVITASEVGFESTEDIDADNVADAISVVNDKTKNVVVAKETISTSSAVPRDADRLGGTITADNIGTMSRIASVGDGTVTGAISTLNSDITELKVFPNNVNRVKKTSNFVLTEDSFVAGVCTQTDSTVMVNGEAMWYSNAPYVIIATPLLLKKGDSIALTDGAFVYVYPIRR